MSKRLQVVGAVSMVEGGRGLGAYLAECYSLERGIARSTEYVMGLSVRKYGEWLGHGATLADLTDFQVSRFLRDLEESGAWSQKTVAGRRGDLLAIWRHAAGVGLVEGPQRVRGVKVPRPMPVAWSLDEFAAILAAALELPGFLKNGIPRGRYFWALLKSGYETGLRRSDLLKVRRSAVGADGVVVVLQHKTGRAHAAAVRADTLAVLVEFCERLERDGQESPDMPLRWPYSLGSLYWWTEKVIAAAGVRPGALQQCRRSGATHAERVCPGSAVRYLGHASVGQAQAHYIDASQAYGVTLPPAVGGTG